MHLIILSNHLVQRGKPTYINHNLPSCSCLKMCFWVLRLMGEPWCGQEVGQWPWGTSSPHSFPQFDSPFQWLDDPAVLLFLYAHALGDGAWTSGRKEKAAKRNISPSLSSIIHSLWFGGIKKKDSWKRILYNILFHFLHGSMTGRPGPEDINKRGEEKTSGTWKKVPYILDG